MGSTSYATSFPMEAGVPGLAGCGNDDHGHKHGQSQANQDGTGAVHRPLDRDVQLVVKVGIKAEVVIGRVSVPGLEPWHRHSPAWWLDVKADLLLGTGAGTRLRREAQPAVPDHVRSLARHGGIGVRDAAAAGDPE